MLIFNAAKTRNFLSLDFNSVKKILSRCGLNIDSELQVFNAANNWMCHDVNQREKYANLVLAKVRLQLLSIPAINQILEINQH